MARVFKTPVTVEGTISTSGVLASTQSLTNEGGQVELSLPSSGSTLSGSNVTIDVYQNKLRIFEAGGTNRGAYIDLTTASTGVGSNLLSGGGSGTVTSVAITVPTGLTITSGSPITTSGTIAIGLQSGYSIPSTTSQTNWDTAYTDRLNWDGGSTGLTASTGRTSLGATTVGSNIFTLTNPGVTSWIRMNADNTVTARSAANTRADLGLGTMALETASNYALLSGASFTGNVSTTGTVTATGNVIGHIATNAQTGTAYTLVLGDDGKIVEMNNASANTLTIPLNASVAFPVGTQITVLQTGAGQTSLAVTAGVTLNATPQATANTAKLRAQWSSCVLVKRATDTWVAMGDLIY